MIEIISNVFLFLVGLAFLIVSSNWLIQASVKLSHTFKLSPLFIGLVVVAFGTSVPEAGVGIIAALRDQKDIALGNIVGSNIANIALILGTCALFYPLKVSKSIFRRELPIMLFATILFYILSIDLLISRLDGLIFIVCFMLFCVISYTGARKSFDAEEIQNFHFKKTIKQLTSPFPIMAITLLTLLGIVWGADLMVKGGSALARVCGVSPWVIGITIFAVGTSLPELAASLAASIKKVHSISVGNIVGSNIFNILFVLGVVAMIRPIPVAASYLTFEYLVLLIFSLTLVIVMKTEYTLTRKEGALLFAGYIVFLIFLLYRKVYP